MSHAKWQKKNKKKTETRKNRHIEKRILDYVKDSTHHDLIELDWGIYVHDKVSGD